MRHADPGAVADKVPAEGRGQVLGVLLEVLEFLTEVKTLGVHDNVEHGNGGAGTVGGLGDVRSPSRNVARQ